MTCTTTGTTNWVLFTGLDFLAPVDVYEAGTNAAEDLSSATITASLLTSDGGTELIADTAQSSGTPGASWSTGRIVVRFDDADTGTAAVVAAIGSAKIGLKVTSGGITTGLGLFTVTIARGF